MTTLTLFVTENQGKNCRFPKPFLANYLARISPPPPKWISVSVGGGCTTEQGKMHWAPSRRFFPTQTRMLKISRFIQNPRIIFWVQSFNDTISAFHGCSRLFSTLLLWWWKPRKKTTTKKPVAAGCSLLNPKVWPLNFKKFGRGFMHNHNFVFFRCIHYSLAIFLQWRARQRYFEGGFT